MKRTPKVTAQRRPTGKPRSFDERPANETVDLSLRLLERLATLREPVSVSELAREFASSKATVLSPPPNSHVGKELGLYRTTLDPQKLVLA
jgi:hypothetical protein